MVQVESASQLAAAKGKRRAPQAQKAQRPRTSSAKQSQPGGKRWYPSAGGKGSDAPPGKRGPGGGSSSSGGHHPRQQVNHKKSHPDPTQQLLFLGMEFDTEVGLVRPSQARCLALSNLAERLVSVPSVSLRELMRLIGMMTSVRRVSSPGRTTQPPGPTLVIGIPSSPTGTKQTGIDPGPSKGNPVLVVVTDQPQTGGPLGPTRHNHDSGNRRLPPRVGSASIGQTSPRNMAPAMGSGPPYQLARAESSAPSTFTLSTRKPKDDFGYGMLKSWLGDGLLISNGSKWARDRKLLTPGFHFDVLKPYAKIFNDCSKVLLSKWHEQSQEGSVDVFHHVSLLTLDCLMNCVFSQDGDCQRQENNPYIRSVYSASQLFAKRFFNMFHYNDVIYYLSSNGRQWRKTLDILHSHSHSVITQRRRALQQEQRSGIKNTRKYIDFLDILLSAKDEDGNGMTDREIQDQVDTFMFEGHDTTASGISWCLYNLAKHAHHQRKCQTEIDDCFAKKTNADLSWDDLNNFPYLTMCIKESLRITPPVLNHSRELTIPLHFPDGTSLPAGMWTSINVYATHHNNSVWENPEVYDPSRFLPEKVKLRSPHAFIPFSAGPRNCIGQNFAMNEMKITLANILHNFELSADESKPVVPIAEIIYKTRNGMFLNL
uniref:Cytochrome P450 4F22-like n=1 Tax=Saccoglossus kowalevskii TaxID=10224 RepID=A0ABM0MFL4_SACKO